MAVRKRHNRPLSHLLQACKRGGKNNCRGLSQPPFPISHISFQCTSPIGPFRTTSCTKHPSEARLVRQAAPAVCQLGMCSPRGCCQWAEPPQKFQAGTRQDEKEENSFLPFPPALQLPQFYVELYSVKHKPPALTQGHTAMGKNREAARHK